MISPRWPAVTCRLDETSHLYGAIPRRQVTEQLRVSHFMPLSLLVTQSDAIAMVQRHVARQFAKYLPLGILELPIPFPGLDLCAYWAKIHRNDRMHSWLRSELADIVENSRDEWLPKLKVPAKPAEVEYAGRRPADA
ncbi:hypothetical protein DVR11_18870 [Paracoccus versutus]|nr:hypothetical protein DVR11_18870 [Paracoccus versutus]